MTLLSKRLKVSLFLVRTVAVHSTPIACQFTSEVASQAILLNPPKALIPLDLELDQGDRGLLPRGVMVGGAPNPLGNLIPLFASYAEESLELNL